MMSTELQLAAQRRQEFEAAVRQHRLIREAQGPQRPTVVRAMGWTGQRLVALGQSLQARAETNDRVRTQQVHTYPV